MQHQQRGSSRNSRILGQLTFESKLHFAVRCAPPRHGSAAKECWVVALSQANHVAGLGLICHRPLVLCLHSSLMVKHHKGAVIEAKIRLLDAGIYESKSSEQPHDPSSSGGGSDTAPPLRLGPPNRLLALFPRNVCSRRVTPWWSIHLNVVATSQGWLPEPEKRHISFENGQDPPKHIYVSGSGEFQVWSQRQRAASAEGNVFPRSKTVTGLAELWCAGTSCHV